MGWIARLPLASIRFRLTAWYTLLLVGILVAIGLPFAALFENELASDRDRRLESTARSILADVEVSFFTVVPRSDTGPGDVRISPARLMLPAIDEHMTRGLVIQINTAENLPWARSSNLGVALPSDGQPPAADEVQLSSIRVGGVPLRTVRLPIVIDGIFAGVVIVGESLRPFERTTRELRQLLVATSAVGVVLAAAGGWLLAGRALRPVDRMTEAAAGIARSTRTTASLGTRLEVPATGDEVARLAATFNAMLDRIQAAFETQHRFLADASHELRTPLTAIRGNVEVALRQSGGADAELPADLLDALEDVRRESDRMSRLLANLLLLARSDAAGGVESMRREPVRLDRLAVDAVRSARGLASGQYIEAFAPAPVEVIGDADRLRQLLLALLDNAIRHTPASGQVVVEVEASASVGAVLRVRDTGEGIAAEHLPHVFERFYRADGARLRATGGTGLGLAIARAIAEAHGGTIAADSQPGRGTTIVVELPASGRSTEGQRSEVPNAPGVSGQAN